MLFPWRETRFVSSAVGNFDSSFPTAETTQGKDLTSTLSNTALDLPFRRQDASLSSRRAASWRPQQEGIPGPVKKIVLNRRPARQESESRAPPRAITLVWWYSIGPTAVRRKPPVRGGSESLKVPPSSAILAS